VQLIFQSLQFEYVIQRFEQFQQLLGFEEKLKMRKNSLFIKYTLHDIQFIIAHFEHTLSSDSWVK